MLFRSAARGIDVDGITHVVNYDLPNEPESYVHRIGRTARAGAAGTAISFCAAPERLYLRDIERLLKRSVPVCENHSYHSTSAANALSSGNGGSAVSPRNRGNPNQRGGGSRSGGRFGRSRSGGGGRGRSR